MPSKEFDEYVLRTLRKNGINENVLFETSHPEFGMLKYESGTMYEDNGDALGVEDIAFILEESDIAVHMDFIEITQIDAMHLMKKNLGDVYTDFEDETMKTVWLSGGKTQLTIMTRESSNGTTGKPVSRKEYSILDFLDMNFYIEKSNKGLIEFECRRGKG